MLNNKIARPQRRMTDRRLKNAIIDWKELFPAMVRECSISTLDAMIYLRADGKIQKAGALASINLVKA